MPQANTDSQTQHTPAEYHLTFDTDWAPDFAVGEILQMLRGGNVKATFFVTHPSDVIKDILSEGHEIGLHPNFLPNSSQGESVEEIMDYLLEIHPSAKTIRTHSLYQSTPLLHKVFSRYPQLEIDLSTLLYKFPHVAPSWWMQDGVSFRRINYNWEDDVAFYDETFEWDRFRPFSNLMVLDFHPIHVALNSSTGDAYKSLKKSLADKPLFSISNEYVRKFRSNSPGAKDLLASVLSSDAQSIDLTELSREDRYAD